MKLKTFFLFFFLVLLISCQPDEEQDTLDPRDKLSGNWVCSETGQYKSTNDVYEVTISNDNSTPDYVIIANFYNLGISYIVKAKVSDYNLFIENQEIKDGFYVKSASGIIADQYNEIKMSYSIDDGSGQIDNVKASYTKK